MGNYNFERCKLFLEEIREVSVDIATRVVSGGSIDNLVLASSMVIEPDELQKISSKTHVLKAGGFMEYLRQFRGRYSGMAYLSWTDEENLVEIKFCDLFVGQDILDCIWQPSRDDVDIVLPNFLTCFIHHDGSVLCIELFD